MSENQIFNSENIKSKVLGTFGSSSSGLGTFGAVHNVCHYTCQGIIALLAVFGVSAAGMPLGFLLDPHLIIIFSSIGLASITLSILLHIKHKSSCIVTNNVIMKKHILVDKKLLVFLAFGVASIVSLVSGTNDVLAKQDMIDVVSETQTTGVSPPTLMMNSKTNSEGDTSMTLTYEGISEEGLVFTVTMETYNMEASSLAEYDLTKLSYIVGYGGTQTNPLSWNIQETGHMGHHLKGKLVFPLEKNDRPITDDQIKSFEIVVNDIAGIKQRVFSWER